MRPRSHRCRRPCYHEGGRRRPRAHGLTRTLYVAVDLSRLVAVEDLAALCRVAGDLLAEISSIP